MKTYRSEQFHCATIWLLISNGIRGTDSWSADRRVPDEKVVFDEMGYFIYLFIYFIMTSYM